WVRIARGRQIVDERVEPDVHRLVRVTGERNAPGQPLPGHRNILEPVLEESHDFVAADLRLHAKLTRLDQLEDAVAVATQPEEVIALLRGDQLERRMLDAVAVRDLRGLLELLTTGAVEALVFPRKEVVRIPTCDRLEKRGNGGPMPGLRRPDPVV